MKEVNEIGERYFKRSKRQYRDGTYIICFDSWPDKPVFDLWANWPACAKEKCIISYRCQYIDNNMYCIIIRNRISKLMMSIEDAFKDNPLSVEKLARIGSELMPLYSQLIRAQMYDEELTAMVKNPESDKPDFTWTYKEVQSLVDRIDKVWREIGIYEGLSGGRPARSGRTKPLPNSVESEEPEKKEEELSYYEELERRHGVREGANGQVG